MTFFKHQRKYKHQASISFALIIASLSLTHSPAFAEKADSQKMTAITSDRSDRNGKTNVTTLTGDVIIIRGTLIVKAARAVMTETATSTSYVLFSAPGVQVFFRQKRDGGADLWVEGVADRVEYDDKTEITKFISKADVKYLDGTVVTQEQKGEYLSYDSLNDLFVAENNSSGTTVPGSGRTTLFIAPKSDKKVK
ncbi:lipopolysaccharide transport periplasmic protein LptA [Undibacterium sp. RTI2.1]|uniref:lipopolysaccharide transport periplasmic protein LptA n=1 Tax=unclassified Undibacterium TaxID=2630295 RepID=UPI002AB330DD|nr:MULTISPECIES: lipopolysaccharide transport periplasmic protein LptA [unclassified Undibacterium]MDY7540279.1 lipopolysaccharide transport periplasmic protein LptA [Undibacterium sp. 5I1]MEB0031141.1 lipopolysaccharide transport periplasmic protein LptA [Undibacterium sp. RTI2.1]MEB0115268.1 lipopolysaccharide transport periplasmic protein LptA [Undibacterium sp. RTI2.2]MEB0232550.1 lipopolysaccharide transport periplasmic protein LptA [Undibacterium sp. 10I3]MEB0259412.1 lipopolysaccharide 